MGTSMARCSVHFAPACETGSKPAATQGTPVAQRLSAAAHSLVAEVVKNLAVLHIVGTWPGFAGRGIDHRPLFARHHASPGLCVDTCRVICSQRGIHCND
jgi:hypothetical protein